MRSDIWGYAYLAVLIVPGVTPTHVERFMPKISHTKRTLGIHGVMGKFSPDLECANVRAPSTDAKCDHLSHPYGVPQACGHVSERQRRAVSEVRFETDQETGPRWSAPTPKTPKKKGVDPLTGEVPVF